MDMIYIFSNLELLENPYLVLFGLLQESNGFNSLGIVSECNNQILFAQK